MRDTVRDVVVGWKMSFVDWGLRSPDGGREMRVSLADRGRILIGIEGAAGFPADLEGAECGCWCSHGSLPGVLVRCPQLLYDSFFFEERLQVSCVNAALEPPFQPQQRPSLHRRTGECREPSRERVDGGSYKAR